MRNSYLALVDHLYHEAFARGYLMIADQQPAFMDGNEWRDLSVATDTHNLAQLLDVYQRVCLRQDIVPAWLDYQKGKFVFHSYKAQAAAGLIGYVMALPLIERIDHKGLRHFSVMPMPGERVELRVGKDYLRLSWEATVSRQGVQSRLLENWIDDLRGIGVFDGLQVARQSPTLAWDGLGAEPPPAALVDQPSVGREGLDRILDRIRPKRVTYRQDEPS